MDWQQNADESPTNLDNRMSENEQIIRQSHKLHHEKHSKQENGISSRKINPGRSENSKK